MALRLVWLPALLCLANAPVAAESLPWLSARVGEGLGQLLAEKLTRTRLAQQQSHEQLVLSGRQIVAAMARRIDGIGESRLLDRAPALVQIELPQIDDRRVDALARYGACSHHLDWLYANQSLDQAQPKLRVTSAVYSAGIVLVSAYLRYHFLAAGGTDGQLQSMLASEEMKALSSAIQGQQELLTYTWRECGPVLSAIAEF